jgi:TolA-binding protein
LLHLKLYHAGQLLVPPNNPAAKTSAVEVKRPLALLSTVIADGAAAQNAEISQRGQSVAAELEYSAPTPDQLRAAALPAVAELVARTHDAVLPGAIRTAGPKQVRDYLRALINDNGPFVSYASYKLISIDREIVAIYRADAKKAWGAKNWGAARAAFAVLIDEYGGTAVGKQAADDLRQLILAQYKDEAIVALLAKNFDGAKTAYRHVIAEYADTNDAVWAQAELKKIVPVAVNYYKEQGLKNFHPEMPGQQGVPQTKGREYFEKMYREEPDGALAPYALYFWSRALGTEGNLGQAVSQLKELLVKFPESEEAPKVLFLLASYQAGKQFKDYEAALQYLAQVCQKYPESSEAPESLWLSAFLLRNNLKRYAEAIVCLEQLKQRYPQNPRSKFVDETIADCRKSIN